MVRNFRVNAAGTATRTVPLFRASKPGRLTKATFIAELAVDGAKTIKIRNETRGVDMTAALTINGIGALGGAALVPNTDGTADFNEGDRISAVYTVSTAGSVGIGDGGLELDIQEGAAYISGGLSG